MSTANLRWSADTAGAEAQILALKAVIGSIKGESSKSLSSASKDFKRLGADAKTSGKDLKLGSLGPLSGVAEAAIKLGRNVESATSSLGRLVSTGGSAGGIMGSLGTTLGGLAPMIGALVSGLAALAAALLVLPALVAAVTFVAVALLDVLTTLTAVAAAFVAPLTLVTGLLGGLGAAFAYVATQSFKNKATLQQQKDALLTLHVAQQTYNDDLAKYGKNATQTEKALLALHKAQDNFEKAQQGVALGALNLDEKFHSLVDTLAKDFAPEIQRLGQAASTALTYLGNIAKLPLDQAFRNLATHGVRLLSKFVYGVANVLKKPFRLAIEIAFGKTGSTAQKSIQSWWDSLRNYLFGYQRTHPIFSADGKFLGITTTSVAGALRPILDWFNKQHFTRTGIRWSNEILGGLSRSKAFNGAITAIAHHAGDEAGKAFVAVFKAELAGIFSFWKSHISYFINPMKGIDQVARSIAGAIGSWAGSLAGSIPGLNTILGLLNSISSIVGGGTGPLFSGNNPQGGPRGKHKLPPVTAIGGIFTSPQVRMIAEAGPEAVIPLSGARGRQALAGMGGVSVVQNFYGFDNATMKVAARKMKAELDRITVRQ